MDRLNVIRQMTAHPEYCLLEHAWGDLTLEAARKAIEEIVEEEADDYFVVLLSDANLDQYSIGALLKHVIGIDVNISSTTTTSVSTDLILKD